MLVTYLPLKFAVALIPHALGAAATRAGDGRDWRTLSGNARTGGAGCAAEREAR
jgi:hypothetical protein